MLRGKLLMTFTQRKGLCRLDKTTHTETGEKLDIVKNLDPDAYGIDIAKIRLK